MCIDFYAYVCIDIHLHVSVHTYIFIGAWNTPTSICIPLHIYWCVIYTSVCLYTDTYVLMRDIYLHLSVYSSIFIIYLYTVTYLLMYTSIHIISHTYIRAHTSTCMHINKYAYKYTATANIYTQCYLDTSILGLCQCETTQISAPVRFMHLYIPANTSIQIKTKKP